MRLALQLASRAVGDTSPNPAVGAVVVKAGRVVGRGYHQRAGLPHAEVNALHQAGGKARGADLYVTLEPCSHTGRTPPCCEAVIAAGIRRVVVGMKDPNPLVDGRGISRLRRAGLHVVTGVLEDEAKRLTASFTKTMTTRLPLVIAKVAQSVDGKIATRTGDSQWISSEASRAHAHRLRRSVDAIVVGVKTVLRDNPRLTARDPARAPRPGRPIRVIVDSRLRTPLTSRCLAVQASAPTILATTARAARRRARFERRGIDVLVLPPSRGRVPLRRLFHELAGRYQVQSVLLEGGGELLASAFQERLVDRIVWFLAPLIIGGRRSVSTVGGEGVARLSQAIRLREVSVRRVGTDVMIEGDVVYPHQGDRGQGTGGRGFLHRSHSPRPSPLAPSAR